MADTISYLIISESGEKSYHSAPASTELPEGARVVDAVPTGEFEAHDLETMEIVCDKAAKADSDCGPRHIEMMHITKTLEARLLINCDIDVGGVLKAEAEENDIPLTDLATAVIENAQAMLDKEIERRKVKGTSAQAPTKHA